MFSWPNLNKAFTKGPVFTDKEPMSTDESGHEVRKSIFILKARPQSLRSAENFLRNRSWDLRPTTDVKMALMSLLKEPVDYVLVGVDHANPTIAKLPDVLMQTLKVPVILFAESMTAQSSMILRSSKYPHVLFPPVSGPAIERMLLKIEKEKNDVDSEKSTLESLAQNQQSTFTSQNAAKVFSGESLVGGANMMMPTNGETSTQQNSASTKSNELVDPNFAQGFAQHNGTYKPQGWQHQNANQHSTPNSGPISGLHSINPAAQQAANSMGGSQRRARRGDESSLTTGLLSPHELLLMAEKADEKRAVEYHSLFSNCTIHALRAVCSPNSEHPASAQVVPIRQNSNIACFEVESPTVSGVVVVAFGTDREADAQFSNELRDQVILYMREQGMELTMNDRISLKIRQIEFEAWSMAEASFLHKTVHRGDEIALSFFVNSDLKTPLEISDDSKMLKMSIDDIRAEVVLDFDVYLHLPVNGKYVRYVGKQGKLSLPQWDRLTARGVSEMHVQKAAAPVVQRYRLQNFINDTVDSYHARKKTGS